MSPLTVGWDTGHVLAAGAARQARYGVAYVQNVCAQFGVDFRETSPDTDFLAIDGTISFGLGETRVQVKCTTDEFTQREQHIRWPVKPKWVRRWSENQNAAYLIVVKVDADAALWADFDVDDVTLHRSAAYWARIDNLGSPAPASVVVPRANRFTPETVRDWNNDLYAGYQ